MVQTFFVYQSHQKYSLQQKITFCKAGKYFFKIIISVRLKRIWDFLHSTRASKVNMQRYLNFCFMEEASVQTNVQVLFRYTVFHDFGLDLKKVLICINVQVALTLTEYMQKLNLKKYKSKLCCQWQLQNMSAVKRYCKVLGHIQL